MRLSCAIYAHLLEGKQTMAKIKLDIYDKFDKTKIEKTLEVEGYDLMMGTIDDFVAIIDLDKINDRTEVAKMAAKGYKQIKPLIMDIFPELQDEDYRNIKMNDLIRLIVQIGTSIMDNMDILKSSKN